MIRGIIDRARSDTGRERRATSLIPPRPITSRYGSSDPLQIASVWSCVQLIAETVATLGWAAWTSTAPDARLVRPQPSILIDPSGTIDAISWRRSIIISWLVRGNAFGVVTATNSAGWPTSIEIVSPDEVTCTLQGPPGTRPRWRLRGAPIEQWPEGPLWHAVGLTLPGSPIGVSVLEHARATIAVSAAAVEYARQWYEEGAHPSAILRTTTHISEEDAAAIKERFLAATRGRREPAVLGGGIDYLPLNAADTQFLDAIRATDRQIASFFFPSSVLHSAETSVTYANVESRALNLLVFDLQPWIVRLERALTTLLPGGTRGQQIRADTSSLLRVDSRSRWQIWDAAVRAGIMSRNEIRLREGLQPVEGADELLWPPYRSVPLEDEDGTVTTQTE